MTVKEGEETPQIPYKMAKLCPMISSKYYEHLINIRCNNNLLERWDLMMGVNDSASCIVSLKKAFNKKNGIPEPDTSASNYYTDIDF